MSQCSGLYKLALKLPSLSHVGRYTRTLRRSRNILLTITGGWRRVSLQMLTYRVRGLGSYLRKMWLQKVWQWQVEDGWSRNVMQTSWAILMFCNFMSKHIWWACVRSSVLDRQKRGDAQESTPGTQLTSILWGRGCIMNPILQIKKIVAERN